MNLEGISRSVAFTPDNLPCHLKDTILDIRSGLTAALAEEFVDFLRSSKRVAHRVVWKLSGIHGLSSAYRSQRSIRVEDYQVEFEILEEVEFHFGQSGVVCRETSVVEFYKALSMKLPMHMPYSPENVALASLTTLLMCTGVSSTLAAT